VPQIRKFVQGEAPALYSVFHSAIHGQALAHYSWEQIEAWAPASIDQDAWAARMSRLQPTVVEIDGVPVAYAALRQDGYLDDFYVATEHAGQGVGSRLMEQVLRDAHALGLGALHSDVSVNAQGFFTRFGFEIVEQRMPVVRGVAMPNARMVRSLDR
jgi:putative acetyltransferase